MSLFTLRSFTATKSGCSRVIHVSRKFSRLTRNYASDAPNKVEAPVQKPVPRTRRALFYVPGSEERKIKSSLNLTADSIVYDLEDSVAFTRKGVAREMVFDILESLPAESKSERAVRINAVGSGLELDDLNVILRAKHLEGIVIPKVRSPKDVQFVSRMIDSIAPKENRSNIRLVASIESALAIMNLKEIATSDPRLDALLFAAEDYCADVGLIRTPSRKELSFARQNIVTTACAYGLQPIDIVCIDFRNDDILREECKEGREMGYLGKQAIHPCQIDIIQKMFLPDEQDVERAARIVYNYEQHSKKGIGAFDLDGKVIDLPVVKWAEGIIARATSGGMDIPVPKEKREEENYLQKTQ
ncbi:8937_t:CDS:10 [Acaulospora morrowiae]|uniref:8937_t:CDS:1 n=1 Tax=Acaulospora morrowiae TaxID=94023 RepID=A0A9N8YZ73_9GLOM|nr:8937_t:CDS:10 [Acaulospora morrowiae]